MAYHIESLALDAENQEYAVHHHPVHKQIQHIILVDAHALVRSALYRVLVAMPSLHIIATYSAVEEVAAPVEHVLKTVRSVTIVLGPSIPVADCLHLVGQLRERSIICGLVLIQQDLHPEMVNTLLIQGVYSLLDKHASEKDLESAIIAASSASIFLNQSAYEGLARAIARTSEHLTEREMQVLSHLKYGESNFCIARKMGLKEKTIEKYLTSIYDKLNVHSRTEAVLCSQKLHI